MKVARLILFSAFLWPEISAAGGSFTMGSKPWGFESRSRENHLAMQMRGPDSVSNSASSGYPGLPVVSNNYAIANWIQVEMVLGDGAVGDIIIDSTQTSEGSQASTSVINGELLELYESN